MAVFDPLHPLLAYAVDTRDPAKQQMAIEIVTTAARISCALALQAIGEFYVAATRKVKLRPLDVQPRVAEFLQTFETFSYSRAAVAIEIGGPPASVATASIASIPTK